MRYFAKKGGIDMKTPLIKALAIHACLISYVNAQDDALQDHALYGQPPVPVLVMHANQEASQGNYQEALIHINQAIEVEPKNARCIKLRGNVRFAQDNYVEAIKDFDTVVGLEPKNAKAYTERAIVHFAMMNFHSALVDADKAAQLNPEDEEAKDLQKLIVKTMKKQSSK
jgi:tetratricopeptide (TPR) repeat protein